MARISAASLTMLAAFGLAARLPVQAAPPQPVVAVFTQSDPQFAETITLYADGS